MSKRSFADKVALVTGGGGQFATTRSNSTVTSTAKLFIVTHDGTLVASETNVWLDASTAQTRVADNNTNQANVSSTLYVGARGGTSAYLNGTIAAFGFTTSVMSTDDKTALHEWSQDVWGTAA
jgi:hypothetical protein